MIRERLTIAPPATVTDPADWPPDYVQVFAWRQRQLLMLRRDPELLAGAKQYYRDPAHCVHFINHWAVTYDPRLAMEAKKITTMPLVLFQKQAELVQFVIECLLAQEGGLVEKSREMGATWVCIWISIWLWLFYEGAAVGWGSRDEDSVDKTGDYNSVFEKIRKALTYVPPEFMPEGFAPRTCESFMRITNPQNNATIFGDAGDNIGRSGRALVYFLDEAAHVKRPDLAEASLSETTRCRIDISSVGPLGNVFNRRREAGVDWSPGAEIEPGQTRVFVMDWSDHPEKNREWYERKRKQKEREGLLHVFAREIDRDYAGAVEGVIIPAEWVAACVDAHLVLGIQIDDDDPWSAALDVADGGNDANALARRQGILLRHADEWPLMRDTGVTARKAATLCAEIAPVDVQYDCIGVGAGVKSETNRLIETGTMPKGVRFVPWNAGAAPQDPEGYVVKGDKKSPKWKAFAHNLKAQGWWLLRRRAEVTWNAINTPGYRWTPDEIMSISSKIPLLGKLKKELSQPTMGTSAGTMKMVVNKTPDGTRSPNLGDAAMMCYHPISSKGIREIPDAALKWAALAGLARGMPR